jgi:hypothetical protein
MGVSNRVLRSAQHADPGRRAPHRKRNPLAPAQSDTAARSDSRPGLHSPAGVLALQRSAGNAAVALSVQRAPLNETYSIELTDDMTRNHVAASEEKARESTKARFFTDKDVDWNTVVKGSPSSVATDVGESDLADGKNGGGDRFYQPIGAAFWQYYAGLKGASGAKVDPATEEQGTVWLKCYEKTLRNNKKIVKVTGIDKVEE